MPLDEELFTRQLPTDRFREQPNAGFDVRAAVAKA